MGVQGVAIPRLEPQPQMRYDRSSIGCCSFAGTESHICKCKTVSNSKPKIPDKTSEFLEPVRFDVREANGVKLVKALYYLSVSSHEHTKMRRLLLK